MNIILDTVISSDIDTLEQAHKDAFLIECERRIDRNTVSGRVITVKAISGKEIIGMGIAEFDKNKNESRILSLYVHIDYRGKRIGTQILKTLVANLEENGFGKVSMIYQSDWDSYSFMKNHFNAHGWAGPKEVARVFLFDIRNFEDKLSEMNFHTQSGQIIESVNNLNSDEQELLKKSLSNYSTENQIPYLFEDEGKIDLNCSTVALSGNEITGWNFCFLKDDKAREYNQFQELNHYKKQELLPALFFASIRKQQELNIPGVIIISDLVTSSILQPYIEKFSSKHFEAYSHFKFSKIL